MSTTRKILCCSLAIGLLAGCAEEKVLTVDVQTGLVPGPEFDRVEVTLFATEGGRYEPNEIDRIVVVDVRFPDSFTRGRRVAEFRPIQLGTRSVRVRLFRPAAQGGTVIIERWVRVRVEDSYALLVRLDRECVGVECPNPGGSAAFTECLGGSCVSPDCDLDDPTTYEEHCCDPLDPTADCPNILFCNDASECAVSADCAETQCVEGACVAERIDGACAAGEWCNPRPSVGCAPLPEREDAGPPEPDAGTDAGLVEIEDAGPSVLDAGSDAGVDAGSDAGPPDAGPTDAGPPPCYQEICEQTIDPCRYGYLDCASDPPVCRPFVPRELGSSCVDDGVPGVCIRGLVCLDCSGTSPPPACSGADTDGDGLPDAEDLEQCDELDNDGDGTVDEGFATHTVYADTDGDGAGDPAAARETCLPTRRPEVDNGEDCDDTDPLIYPGAPERCGGENDDCDGAIDELIDVDGNGFGGGDGSAADPFRICIPKHLDGIRRLLPDGMFYEQMADLDLSGTFSPLDLADPTPFVGEYDGGGYQIRGLSIDTSADVPLTGLFGQNAGVIHDLAVEAPAVRGGELVGVIAGRNSGSIRDVRIREARVEGRSSVGGIVAQNDGGTIERCTVDLGRVYSAANGSRIGTTFDTGAGGIVGVSYGGTLRDLTSSAAVTWEPTGMAIPAWTFTGGLAGYAPNVLVERSHASGEVLGILNVGGLIGVCEGLGVLRDVSASGSVTGASGVGGLVGYDKCIVERAIATGDVSGRNLVGAFEGGRECFSTSYASEIVATGRARADDLVGGMFGRIFMRAGTSGGYVRDAYAMGAFEVTGAGAGGAFVGSYGLGGQLACPIERSYAAGRWIPVTPPGANAGGWAGISPLAPLVSESYFRSDVWAAALGESGSLAGVEGLTDALFVDPSSFPAYDFSAVWVMPTERRAGDLLSPGLAFECGVTLTCP